MAKKYDDFDESDQDGVFGLVVGLVSRHKRGFAVGCVLAAMVALGLVIWGSSPHKGSMDEAQGENVPIVRADAGDYKTAPDNPGGMDIPYRDSTVFSSNGDSGKTENILADDKTEQPISKTQAFAGFKTADATGSTPTMVSPNGTAPVANAPADGGLPGATIAPSTPQSGSLPDGKAPSTNLPGGTPTMVSPSNATPADGGLPGGTPQSGGLPGASGTPGTSPRSEAPSVTPGKFAAVEPPSNDALVKEAIGTGTTSSFKTITPPMTATTTALAKPAPSSITSASVMPAPAKPKNTDVAMKAARTEPAAGAAIGVKGVQTGSTYIQVASVKSAGAAPAAFKVIQAKYSGLNGVKFRTQEVNLGPKGDFYRVQAGPMSKDSATAICAQMKKAAPGSCLIVVK